LAFKGGNRKLHPPSGSILTPPSGSRQGMPVRETQLSRTTTREIFPSFPFPLPLILVASKTDKAATKPVQKLVASKTDKPATKPVQNGTNAADFFRFPKPPGKPPPPLRPRGPTPVQQISLSRFPNPAPV